MGSSECLPKDLPEWGAGAAFQAEGPQQRDGQGMDRAAPKGGARWQKPQVRFWASGQRNVVQEGHVAGCEMRFPGEPLLTIPHPIWVPPLLRNFLQEATSEPTSPSVHMTLHLRSPGHGILCCRVTVTLPGRCALRGSACFCS